LKDGFRLAPVIGIGCPIEEDGSISRGAQNLPGDWSSSTFNLAKAIHNGIPHIGDPRDTGRHAQRCGGAGPERAALLGFVFAPEGCRAHNVPRP